MDKQHPSSGLSSFAEHFRAVAIDLDGTALRPDSTFSQRTLDVFKTCFIRGIPVVIVTGRSPKSAEKFLSVLNASGPMVYYNGAAVIDAPSGKVLASTLVPTDVISGCLEIAKKFDIHFQAFLSNDRLVCRDLRPESAAYKERTGLHGEILDFDSLLNASGPDAPSFIKGMFIAEPEMLEKVQQEIDLRFGTRVYRTRSHATFLEVMNNGVSKGNALKVALKLRGFESSECVAFGDAENDLTMLEAVGWGVAMANADPELKKKADDVASSNLDDGVAAYIEALLALRN